YAFLGKDIDHVRQQSDRFQDVVRHHWHHHIELEVSVRACPGDCHVIADHLCTHHHHRFGHHWVYFSRHDRAARLCGRQLNFPDPAARTATEPAYIIRNFEESYGDSFKMAAGFDNGVFAALGFEMIFRFVECYAGTLRDVVQHFFWKIDMAI